MELMDLCLVRGLLIKLMRPQELPKIRLFICSTSEFLDHILTLLSRLRCLEFALLCFS